MLHLSRNTAVTRVRGAAVKLHTDKIARNTYEQLVIQRISMRGEVAEQLIRRVQNGVLGVVWICCLIDPFGIIGIIWDGNANVGSSVALTDSWLATRKDPVQDLPNACISQFVGGISKMLPGWQVATGSSGGRKFPSHCDCRNDITKEML